MFTGIVQGKARVQRIERHPEFAKLIVSVPAGPYPDKIGDSIAINGTCLTIERFDGDAVGFHLLTETLRVTNLGGLASGDLVNFERALRAGDSLGGHWVLGHVDAVGRVVDVRPLSGQTELFVRIPREFSAFCPSKGSIAIDGVSLTIAAVDDDVLKFCLIPETLERTILGDRRPEDHANIEADYMAKLIVAQIARMKESGLLK